MTELCSELVSFVDGELADDRAEAFRTHLVTCPACQAELIEAMQLSARLDELPSPTTQLELERDAAAPVDPIGGVDPVEPVDAVRAVDARPAVVADAPPAPPASAEPSPPVALREPRPAESPDLLFRAPRRPVPRWKQWTAGVTTAIGVAAGVLFITHRPGKPTIVSTADDNAFAELTTRPFDVRFAYGDASRHRPVRPATRGAGDSLPPPPEGEHAGSVVAPPRDRVAPLAVAALERKRDEHGRALAGVWNREDLSEITERLRRIQQTPQVKNDLAAVQIPGTTDDNLEPILAELEALRGDKDPVVARAARWNYALLLSKLGLAVSAAEAFRAIAADREPGWSAEAAERARAGDMAKTSLARWNDALRNGSALLAPGAPIPHHLLQATPGIMRAYFYDAVRTAPSQDGVLALAPIAAELDQPGEPPVLSDYVQRVAKLDFRLRAPLAKVYARLLAGQPITAAETRALTTPSPAREAIDIVMGAMNRLRVVPEHAEAFRSMVKASDDPWFEIVLAKAEARTARTRGDWRGAEARLRTAEKLCRANTGITYQCLDLASDLGSLYQDAHQVPEALAVLRPALAAARSVGEWGRIRQLLAQLADLERLNSSIAAVRAYANEVRLTAEGSCDHNSVDASRSLTGAAVLALDGRAARQALEEVVTCKQQNINTANDLADIARLDPQPGDLETLQGWLRELRAGTTLTAAQRVLADELEGRLVVERDRAAGVALLERAIAAAHALPDDVLADKARAGAYSVLVLDAARHDEPARALSLLAQRLGLPLPASCAVGLDAEDERAVVIVRGADGNDHAKYDAKRDPRTPAHQVPDDLSRALTGCGRVQVIALAALQGLPRVLPPALPWSYVTGARRRGGNPGQPTTPRTVIIANVTPPATLKLPELMYQPRAPDPRIEALSGPEATPRRVLAAIQDASEIQFHTHALTDVALSDASHLALSPEPNGSYALTAEAIRGTTLRGHPVIVLAACQSGRGARYQHAPWSLPHAFLAAGARAVFATATNIPDRESGSFFNDVLADVRAGADPAIALRDRRVGALASQPSSWVADVVLFE